LVLTRKNIPYWPVLGSTRRSNGWLPDLGGLKPCPSPLHEPFGQGKARAACFWTSFGFDSFSKPIRRPIEQQAVCADDGCGASISALLPAAVPPAGKSTTGEQARVVVTRLFCRQQPQNPELESAPTTSSIRCRCLAVLSRPPEHASSVGPALHHEMRSRLRRCVRGTCDDETQGTRNLTSKLMLTILAGVADGNGRSCLSDRREARVRLGVSSRP
jgi:hypothetical protein